MSKVNCQRRPVLGLLLLLILLRPLLSQDLKEGEREDATPPGGAGLGNPLDYLVGLETKLEAAGDNAEEREKVFAEARATAADRIVELDKTISLLESEGVKGARIELVRRMRQLAADGARELAMRAEYAKTLLSAAEQKSVARKRRLEAEDEERVLGVELAKVAASEITVAEVNGCGAACASLDRQLNECRSEVEKLKEKRVAARRLISELEKQVAGGKADVQTATGKHAEGTEAETEARAALDVAGAALTLFECQLLHARIALDIVQIQVETSANTLQQINIGAVVAKRRLEALQKRREAIELAEEDARLRNEKERLLEQDRRLTQLARDTTTALQKELLNEERINYEVESNITYVEMKSLKSRSDRSKFTQETVAPRLVNLQAEKDSLEIRGLSPSDYIDKREKATLETMQLGARLNVLRAELGAARERLSEVQAQLEERMTASSSRMEHGRSNKDRAAILAEALAPADRAGVLDEWDKFLTRLAEILKLRNELRSKEVRAHEQLCAHLEGYRADVENLTKELQGWLTFLDQRYSRLTTRIAGIEIPLSPLTVVGIAVVLLVVLFFLLNFAGVRIWERWLGRETQLGRPGRTSPGKAVKLISLVLIGIAVPAVVVNILAVPEKVATVVNKAAFILLISLCLFLLGKLVLHFLYKFTTRHGQTVTLGGPLHALVRVALIVIGVLIVLDAIGISITPLLTTLGIGSVAVALALQDTLSNFFAGLYLTADRPVRVGDYIKIDDQTEGYVSSISWRSTRILTFGNNTIVVPNQKLAQSIIQNYSLPDKRVRLKVPVNVSYDADPSHVERVLLEEMEEALKVVPGMLAEPAPVVRFIPGFGESSLNFTVMCQVREFNDQYSVQHELRKLIFARFKKEGIEIPFPIRTIYVKGDKADQQGIIGKGDKV